MRMKLSLRTWHSVVASLTLLLWISSSSIFADDYDREHLQKIESQVKAVVEKALPCTVGIGSRNIAGGGSGVVISKDGLVLTAGHVTQAAGEELHISFPDGRRVAAKALGANYDRDTGMAQITEEGEYPFVELGDSETLQVDQWCIALGHAGGFQNDRSPPIRLGRVLSKENGGFLSTDCTLIGGDSGGPLFDLQGNLIGIHSNIGASLSENRHVPIVAFEQQWNRLKAGEKWGKLGAGDLEPDPNRPMIGVVPLERVDNGIRVDPLPNGAAKQAGVQKGDVIKSIAGNPTPNVRSLVAAVIEHRLGEEVEVVLQRGEEELTLTVKIGRSGDLAREETPEEDNSSENEESNDEEAAIADRDNEEDSDDLELDEQLKQLVEDSNRGEKPLILPSQITRKLGGPQKVMRRIKQLFDEKIVERILKTGISQRDEFYEAIIAAYQKVVNTASQSVYPLFHDKKQIGLATAIRENGYLITKASEVMEKDVEIMVADKRLPLEIIETFEDHDVAIVKADAKLVPITWYVSTTNPPLGTFVAAAGVDSKPLAIGVVSVAERSLSQSDKAYLGVGLEMVDTGLRIRGVQRGTAAAKSGLQAGDIITSLEDKPYREVGKFIQDLLKRKPGDKVRIEFTRGEEELNKIIELGSRDAMPKLPEPQGFPTGGRLSTNRSGYPNAIQTDLPIRPEQCGSPLVDLNGRLLGINIARAGRIKSYAIPADVLQEFTKNLE